MSISLTIDDNPKTNDGHHKWADYIELLCLQNIDGEVSSNYVIDRIREKDALNNPGEYEKSEVSIRWATDAENWFRHLRFRQGIFNDFYPFELVDNEDTLQLKAPLSSKHLLYVYLLLSSNLKYVDKSTSASSTLKIQVW